MRNAYAKKSPFLPHWLVPSSVLQTHREGQNQLVKAAPATIDDELAATWQGEIYLGQRQ